MRNSFALAPLCALAIAIAADQPAYAESKCSGTKIKAAGKKTLAKLSYLAKSVTTGIPPDAECLSKAEEKVSQAYDRAESKSYSDPGCLTTDDTDEIEAMVDDAVVADLDHRTGRAEERDVCRGADRGGLQRPQRPREQDALRFRWLGRLPSRLGAAGKPHGRSRPNRIFGYNNPAGTSVAVGMRAEGSSYVLAQNNVWVSFPKAFVGAGSTIATTTSCSPIGCGVP